MKRRNSYLSRTALFTAVALIGIGMPLTLEQRAAGLALKVKSALAEKGRGGGDSGGGRGSDSRGGDDNGGGRGSDSRGSDSRGGDDRGGDDSRGGRGSDDRGGDDSGGSASSQDDADDDGGQGRGRGRGRGGDEAEAAEDGEDQGRGRGSDEAVAGDEDGGRGRGGSDGRPEAVVDLSDEDLSRVFSGRRTLVDDRGRVLEVEVEVEDGRRTVTVKPHGGAAQRNPGPITAVRAVDPAGGPARSVRVEAASPGAAAGTSAPAARAVVRSGDDGPRQIGDDLSRREEESLIESGWR